METGREGRGSQKRGAERRWTGIGKEEDWRGEKRRGEERDRGEERRGEDRMGGKRREMEERRGGEEWRGDGRGEEEGDARGAEGRKKAVSLDERHRYLRATVAKYRKIHK